MARAARQVAAAFGVAAILCSGTSARALQSLNIHQDIIQDAASPPGRHDRWLDSTFLVAWPQVHASVTLGSFDAGAEIGGFRRDRRGSNYGLLLRRRHGGFVENTSLEVDTQQKLSRAVVSGAMRLFWPDHPEGDNLSWVPSAGIDFYYQAESFATVRVTRDPRPWAGTTFRLANRVGTARRYCDISVSPRTDGAVGFGLYGRFEWFMGGFGRETDYDFTSIDRQTFFFGFQYEM